MKNQQTHNDALDQWLQALGHEEPLTRTEAAESPPEDVDDARIVAALVPLLGDASELVRLSAAETLGRYPCEAALTALRAYVTQEQEPLARAHGLSSLGLVGEAQDMDILCRELGPAAEPAVAVHSMVGLFELVRRLCKQGLIAYLDHANPEVRSLAADALGSVVQYRDDSDVLLALRERLAGEPVDGARSNIRVVIEEVWGTEAVDDR